MKILQINASYKPAYIYGGPALSVSRLCEALVRAGAELEVLTTTANGKDELDVKVDQTVEIDGVQVTYFKRVTKDHTHFSPTLLRSLKKKLQELRPKQHQAINCIVHIHVWWNLVSVFSCLLARLNKTPVILTPRGTLSNYSFGNRNAGIKYYIHRFIGKSLLEYCHIQVTSKKEEQAVLALVKPKSITVIPNFVYLPEMETGQNNNSPANTDSHTIKLLFLSRVEEKKGLDLLFSALAECNFNFQLTIAGTGNPNYITYLKDLLKQLKIEAYIEWIGQQNQKEKWDVLQRHDLMILPSHDENFANVVIECLATGTPVLISNKVGLADYIQSQNFGWICNVDKDSIKENLLLFKAQPQKAALIRQIAPEKIRVDFDEKQLVKQFLKLYSDISKAE